MEDSSFTSSSRVRYFELEEAKHSFEELFDLNKNSKNRPLKERKFPESFFCPELIKNSEQHNNDFVISHSKTNSSPASFGHQNSSNLAVFPVHSHQKSLDANVARRVDKSKPPLPDFANRNQAEKFYGIDLKHAKLPIPEGYEMAINGENKVYFLDHKTQQTSWFDPRIPQAYQKWGMTLAELDTAHKNYNRQMDQFHHNNSQTARGPSSNDHITVSHQRMNAIAMNYPVIADQNGYHDGSYGGTFEGQQYPGGLLASGQPLEQDMEELQLSKIENDSSFDIAEKLLYSKHCLIEEHNNNKINNNNDFNLYGPPVSAVSGTFSNNTKNANNRKDSHVNNNNGSSAAILSSGYLEDGINLGNEEILNTPNLSDVIRTKGPQAPLQHSYQNSIDSGVCHTNISIGEEDLLYSCQPTSNMNPILGKSKMTNKYGFLPLEEMDNNYSLSESNGSMSFRG